MLIANIINEFNICFDTSADTEHWSNEKPGYVSPRQPRIQTECDVLSPKLRGPPGDYKGLVIDSDKIRIG